MNRKFAEDVEKGLSSPDKKLPSKYFYDATGDEIFVKIMNMPEYYLTDVELEIFRSQTDKIINSFGMNGDHFELIELGAGDGEKVIKMLQDLRGRNFTYAPVDISKNAIDKLEARLQNEVPGLDFEGMQGEYFEVLDSLKEVGQKVILFLGSNIGNLTDHQAHEFMVKISASMNRNDKLLIGFDLKKDPEIIKNAYDDSHGFTRDFNLNLLTRINRELGGNFSVGNFNHLAIYDAEKGVALSYLESQKDQKVTIRSLNKSFQFRKGEKIHTEISRKYDLETIRKIAEHTGLNVKELFFDSRKYFVDVLFEKSPSNHVISN